MVILVGGGGGDGGDGGGGEGGGEGGYGTELLKLDDTLVTYMNI